MKDFESAVEAHTGAPLRSAGIELLQVNLGLRCNQHCAHCHVGAGPHRPEVMGPEVIDQVLETAGRLRCRLVDLTGGAPEMNPHFRRFVAALCAQGSVVQVRTNLTALLLPDQQGTMEFLRERNVRLAASMPCYLEENVRAQRGAGAYEHSIQAMRRLNALGYGTPNGPALDLVYNPSGAFLPPPQADLEQDYRRELAERFGVVFTRLLTIANMPIGRFAEILRREGGEPRYLRLLQESFNPATLDALMCRRQVSVGWDGALYDCDFNLALRVPVNHGAPDHIRRFDAAALVGRRIVTGEHCYACTAGCGSSCGGALV